ncbi:hypothetical protein GPJ56_005380 [Histomonas meleagridis]|uniref:uncharacterized protein n=1 Tax=Histomonas meleagridis TaxID=135588 RepID=UPI00355A9AA3|nr:hypothetical protein GPJ56_005380 [Histomonas meleagridis]KAH0803564.1 hypothetical protein GO595_003615 [Histomonas meleagridis]
MFFLNGKGDVCFLEVRDDKTVSDPTTIKNGTFCGLHCLCNGTVLFYSKNEICTYSLQPTPIIIGTTLINNHEIDKIIFMREPRVFIVMTKNGRLVVCRHPSFSKADKKPEIEQMELFQYHKEPIKVGCCGEELSFMTVDESGVCVLWENFPNWLDAPFTLGMFGESE